MAWLCSNKTLFIKSGSQHAGPDDNINDNKITLLGIYCVKCFNISFVLHNFSLVYTCIITCIDEETVSSVK